MSVKNTIVVIYYYRVILYANDLDIVRQAWMVNLPLDICKRLAGCDVVDHDDAMRSSVICWGDCSKPLLSGRVPNLKFDSAKEVKKLFKAAMIWILKAHSHLSQRSEDFAVECVNAERKKFLSLCINATVHCWIRTGVNEP